MNFRIAAVLVPLLLASVAHSEWEKLENVRYQNNPSNDGDSFHVVHNGNAYYLRLYFVDTPETQDRLKDRIEEQAKVFGIKPKNVKKMGKKAAQFTQEHLNKPFTVWTERTDAQGDSGMVRYFAFVTNSQGEDLGQALVGNGLARVYGAQADHPKGPNRMGQWEILNRLEQTAKAKQLGCWDKKLK